LDSEDINSLDNIVKGITFNGEDTMFAGEGNDKLFKLAGNFTSSLLDSISVSETGLGDIATDDVDARLGNGGVIIFRRRMEG
jgi:hypothetical protein